MERTINKHLTPSCLPARVTIGPDPENQRRRRDKRHRQAGGGDKGDYEMPYWVEQTKGPVVDRLNQINQQYRNKEISLKDAFIAHHKLYTESRGRDPFVRNWCPDHPSCPEAAYQFRLTERGPEHIDYLINWWFPMYTNFYFEGTERQCYAVALKLERQNQGHSYTVAYEY